MTLSWTAIIPVKPFGTGKSRLGATPSRRAALARAFALDTIEACGRCERIEQVIVVSDEDCFDDTRNRASRTGGFLRLPDPGGGLNSALRRTALEMAPDSPVLSLLGDLPAVTPDDLDVFLEIAAEGPRAFSPDSAGIGTTALASSHGRQLDPAFGVRSRAAHRGSGAREVSDARLARLRRDVDTPVDLAHAILLGMGARSTEVLAADFR